MMYLSRRLMLLRCQKMQQQIRMLLPVFRVAFKPVATILMEQHTVNINGTDTTMKAKGRHDACVLPRAVPIVEAMAAMTILDYYLIDRTTQL